jgi:hypothetical protein
MQTRCAIWTQWYFTFRIAVHILSTTIVATDFIAMAFWAYTHRKCIHFFRPENQKRIVQVRF